MDSLQGERNDVYDLIALLTSVHAKNGESVATPFLAGDAKIAGDYFLLTSLKYMKPTLSPKDPNYVDPRSEADLALSVQKVSEICKVQGIEVTDEEILKILQH